jgi:Ca2+-binding RTX toxin-like protein
MQHRLILLPVLIGVATLALAPRADSSTPSCFGKPATIVGTEGDETLFGTDGNDVIVGLGGDDQVIARDGDDLVCGNGGDDILNGGDGNDKLSLGPRGADKGPFNPDQNASGGPETVGNDLLVGADDSDDQLDGQVGDDVLKGLTGEDAISGEEGHDKLYGGGNNDVVHADDGEADFVNGGGGTDNCFFDPGVDTVKKCP